MIINYRTNSRLNGRLVSTMTILAAFKINKKASKQTIPANKYNAYTHNKKKNNRLI